MAPMYKVQKPSRYRQNNCSHSEGSKQTQSTNCCFHCQVLKTYIIMPQSFKSITCCKPFLGYFRKFKGKNVKNTVDTVRDIRCRHFVSHKVLTTKNIKRNVLRIHPYNIQYTEVYFTEIL